MNLLKNNIIFFVVGNSRSGTTMLGRILGRQKNISTFPELHFFEQLVAFEDIDSDKEWSPDSLLPMTNRLINNIRNGYFAPKKNYDVISKKLISELGQLNPMELYLKVLLSEMSGSGKHIPLEQTPRYLFSAGQILEKLPNAKIINMIRDPRAVMLSQKHKWKRRRLGAKTIPRLEAFRSWANYHPIFITKLWRANVLEAKKYEKHPRFFSIKFEDLVNSPEPAIKNICDFLGVIYSDDMLEIPKVGSSTKEDASNQKGIDSNIANSWKNGGLTHYELNLCHKVCNKEMRELGYESSAVAQSLFVSLYNIPVIIFKGCISVMLNLGRTKNIFSSIKKRFL
ncbi:MAG: sulfotransferase [Kangiellaceae bacterium]|nr:sulfotransferase [Kangiellaceae bacterium]